MNVVIQSILMYTYSPPKTSSLNEVDQRNYKIVKGSVAKLKKKEF